MSRGRPRVLSLEELGDVFRVEVPVRRERVRPGFASRGRFGDRLVTVDLVEERPLDAPPPAHPRANPKPRTEGPCSAVVVRYKRRSYVDGVRVTPAQRRAALAPPA